jgi:aldehyde:ferredoxin oxidoreductase
MTNPGYRLMAIDLSEGSSEMEVVPQEDIQAFLGGSALGARLACAEMRPELDPLEENAPIFVLTGPLTGTAGPAVGRFTICAKSPATGLWGESNCGGFFGSELRKAGIDGLRIRGRAAEPVYISLRAGRMEILPAKHLWGIYDTYETQHAIREELGDRSTRIATIGRAGETQMRFANVSCDHGRFAGRTGLGAVFGSKLLKGIAVRGSQAVPLARAEAYARLRSEANIALKEDTLSAAFRELGTGAGAEYFDYLGTMPKRYFTGDTFEGVERVSGGNMAATILTGISACHACVIACGRRVKLSDGEERKGPEYETITGFGPNLGIDDLEAITILGEWCDRYGMDTISVSNTIGLAYLLFERGMVTEKETGGLSLVWGNAEAALELVHQIGRGEGFGEQLAEGALALAARYGDPEVAAQVNGLEVAYHDPRGASGMALVYATSPRGACHNQSDYFMVDLGQSVEAVGVEFMDRQGGAEKAGNVARHQDWSTLRDALVICILANVPAQTIVDLVNAATGFDFSIEEMLQIGERAWNLKRTINNKLGLVRDNDRLPGHLMVPLEGGGAAGYVPPLDEMLEAYYAARGWDAKTGEPSAAKLKELGLDQIVT